MLERIVFLFLFVLAVSGLKKDDCEVCFRVVDDFRATLSDADIKAPALIEKKFSSFCAEKKGKESRFCYYLGGLEESATGILKELSTPLSNHLPTDKVCERLKKRDSQVCELRFEKEIDLATVDLHKLKVRDLRRILTDLGLDCDGCVEKSEYVKRIEEERVRRGIVKQEL